ncbi:Pentapeptide_repeats-containing protein [Hexamita inflata]|uniref:Pentapeptide repeats-containing protein n=1 Tax=Hexamita inflata TaxID=28002 RepID=A0AA86QHR0_9EUKA|nr:Pentapeptide repeats-containing protein [Hexamita inflata]
MIILESNAKVIKILKNIDYIKQNKKGLKDAFNKTESEQLKMINNWNIQLNEVLNQDLKNNKFDQIKLYTQNLEYLKDNIGIEIQQLQIEMKKIENISTQLDNNQKTLNLIDSKIQRSIIEINKEIRKYQQQYYQDYTQSLAMYIPQKGVQKYSDIQNQQKYIDVDKQVNSFIENEEATVMLIQGAAGTGKTMLCHWLIQNLLKTEKYIPIYISLSQTENYLTNLVEESLQNMKINDNEHQQLINLQQQIILIIDGYDEIGCQKNLYNTNKLEQYNCKMIITCRSTYVLNNPTYFKLFTPKNQTQNYCELIIVMFTENQIWEYLQRHINNIKLTKENWNDWQVYKQWIINIPGLIELVQNPFILNMIVEVLPIIVESKQYENINQKLLSLDIYEKFICNWFNNEENKIIVNNNIISIPNILDMFEEVSTKLAIMMFNDGISSIKYDKYRQNKWTKYLDPNDINKSTVLRGVPLQNSNQYYCYIHKTILEYFTMKGGINNILTSNYVDINIKLITDEGLIKFYTEYLQKHPDMNQLLLQIVIQSKTNNDMQVAAANAITILNFANFNFNGMDLSGINIPFANLQSCLMDSVNFSNSNLNNVNFENSWLRNSNFTNSDMSDVIFGEMKYIDAEYDIYCMVANQNMKILVTANEFVDIWHSETQQLKFRIKNHTSTVNALDINSNQNMIATASNQINIFDAETGKTIIELNYEQQRIITIAFSASGRYIASGCEDQCIRIYDLLLKKELIIINEVHSAINKICFSCDEKCIASCGREPDIKIWNLQGQLIHTLTGHTDFVWAVQFSQNSKYLASVDRMGQLIVWDALTFQQVKSVNAHSQQISDVQFSVNGEYLATCSFDTTVKIWNIQNLEVIKKFQGHSSFVRCVQFINETTLVSGGRDNLIKYWDLQYISFKSLSKFQYIDKKYNCLVSNIEETIVASGDDNSTITLWDINSGKSILMLKNEQTETIQAIQFSYDGKYIAGASESQIFVWDIDKKIIKFFKNTQCGVIYAISFNLDNTLIAVGGLNKIVYVYNIVSGLIEITLNGMKTPVYQIQFVKQNEQLVLLVNEMQYQFCFDMKGQLLSKTLNNIRQDPYNIYLDKIQQQAYIYENKSIIMKNYESNKIIWVQGVHSINIHGIQPGNFLSANNLALISQQK